LAKVLLVVFEAFADLTGAVVQLVRISLAVARIGRNRESEGAASMTRPRTVSATLDLRLTIATLVKVTADHVGRSDSETVADALRLLFVALPRPGDGAIAAND
jgi:hypothetical protein